MKILFAVQATGNGHLSRAREIIPHLLNHGEVDLLVSGSDSQVSLPYIIKYKKHGMGFSFGKKGGIDYIQTIKKLKPFRLLKDIYTFPVEQYDVVINDFEPVTAWACRRRNKPCIALSHQSAYLSPLTPRPTKKDKFAEWIFRNYAPVSAAVGLHFQAYDSFIHTPVIRQEVRQLEPTDEGHYTVYLPAFDDKFLVQKFMKVSNATWQVFTKHSQRPYQVENVEVLPIENNSYLKSLASGRGLLTGGGFEAPAEAMFLGKKVMSIPMLGQYEQQCNAIAIRKLGVKVVTEIGEHFLQKLHCWIEFEKSVVVDYPDQTEMLVSKAIKLAKYASNAEPLLGQKLDWAV